MSILKCPTRHCERSEAIHSFFVRRHGLLRFARNDGGYSFAFSRRIAPEVCWKSSPSIVRGRRECRMHAAPEVPCAMCRRVRARAYRAAEAIRHSLRNGFTAYFVLSPENGSFASVAARDLPRNLTPAPRRQDHTALFWG